MPDAPILRDNEKIISEVGMRDSKATMITKSTHNILIFSWGAKGVSSEAVAAVVEECASLIEKQSSQ